MSTVVVIPFKSFSEGKSRLADVLGPTARGRLCRYMLERTVALATKLGETIVVSGDASVPDVLAGLPGQVRFLQPRPACDLNRALHQARRLIAPGSAMLVLPTDLVLLEAAELSTFVQHSDRLCIAPDAAREGTNLLHLPAGAVPHFRFGFGADSFSSHTSEARRLGYEHHLHESPGARLDLDTPADLAVVCQLQGSDFYLPLFD